MKLAIYKFDNVTSTNDIAMNLIKKHKKKSGCIYAKLQTKGRGQYGKKWISIKGNLFVSVFFKIDNRISIERFTKLNCIKIKKILNFFIKKKIKIKYPNDLFVDNCKICGILQETLFYKDKKFAIIGIGVNIVKSPKIENYPTTYMNNYVKGSIDKKKIFRLIKNSYEMRN